MSNILDVPLSKRSFLQGGLLFAAAAASNNLSTELLAQTLDFDASPEDISKFLNENEDVRLTVRALGQSHKYKDDPEKMRASIRALGIGIGQYGRYRKALDELKGSSRDSEAARHTLRSDFAAETYRLMCKKEALTSLMIVEMCHSLSDPNVRADEAYRSAKTFSKVYNAGKAWASYSSPGFGLFLEFAGMLVPDAEDIAANIRKGPDDKYWERTFTMGQYLYGSLHSEYEKKYGEALPRDESFLVEPLKNPEVQDQTKYKPGPLSEEDLANLPPETRKFLEEMYRLGGRDDKERAQKVAELLFDKIREEGNRQGTEYARFRQQAEEDRIKSLRAEQLRISHWQGNIQLASLFIAHVLKDPQLANALSNFANNVFDVSRMNSQYMAEQKDGMGQSIAGSALTASYIGLAIQFMELWMMVVREPDDTPSPYQIIYDEIIKVREDMQNLRDEMHQRFDRLERQNMLILEGLEQILGKLDKGFTNITNELAEHAKTLAKERKYHLVDKRQDAQTQLSEAIAKLIAQTGRDPRYTRSNAYKSEIRNLKGQAFNHAEKRSRISVSNGSFEKESLASPEGLVDAVDLRADPNNLMGLLPYALRYLGVANERVNLPNPEIWYEGVAAYIQMLASTFPDATPADDGFIEVLYKMGKESSEYIKKTITPDTLKRAGDKYRSAVDRLTARIADLFLEQISERTNNRNAEIYRHVPQFTGILPLAYFNPTDRAESVALDLGLIEYSLGERWEVKVPSFPMAGGHTEEMNFGFYAGQSVQINFRKGKGWNNLTLGNTSQHTARNGGYIMYSTDKLYTLDKINHGVRLMVCAPPPGNNTALPLSENRDPRLFNLTGSLTTDTSASTRDQWTKSPRGPQGPLPLFQPKDTAPTYTLYEMFGEAVDAYSEEIRRETAAHILLNFKALFPSEVAEVDASSAALELVSSVYGYRLGEDWSGHTWPRAARAKEYVELLSALMTADSIERLKFIDSTKSLRSYAADPSWFQIKEERLPCADPIECYLRDNIDKRTRVLRNIPVEVKDSLRVPYEVKDFDTTQIPHREQIAHADHTDGLRIDNYIISAFRKAAEQVISGLTPSLEPAPADGLLPLERGLMELRLVGYGRKLQLEAATP
jgi:hypothetical protein